MEDLFINVYKLDGQYSVGNLDVYNTFDRADKEATKSEAFIGTFKIVKAEQEPEQPQTEPQSQELKTMLIADAQKAGLKIGDRIWIELEVEKFDDGDNTVKIKRTINNAWFWAKTNSTRCIYTPQPFTPKHGEKCRALTTDCIDIYECTAVEIKGKIFAYAEFGEDEGSRIFHPEEIKQFLPLE